ncbi:hypothetical protein [Neobacillus mesonae]|uniref:hypothetical protein n=1 Tax=Neobacillus mesonae TaxID=1193713 RepID=UPI00203ED8B3|nr:hypothetical protein [Neobacillus mesonae]MCM3570620.1 hypothetical protein [Neobacillus mesonae]
MSKKPLRITESFRSKEALLQNTFGTSNFEKFRNRTFFLLEDGKTFSLHDNKQFRFNLVKPIKHLSTFENMEQARLGVVKDELKDNPKVRRQAIHRTLEKHFIPIDLMGKPVTVNSILKEDQGIKISLEDNGKERQIKLPDLAEKWMDRVREQPKLKAAFDEIIMDSRLIGEVFLAFYDIEINKVLQTKQHDFEVISVQKGSYIGKLNCDGKIKKLSPYFPEKEAKRQLEKLNVHIQREKVKKGRGDLEVEPCLEFEDISAET